MGANNHPNRNAVATIAHNDERINRRVYLYIRRERIDGKNQYAIFTGSGEDAGQYRFASRAEALEAIEKIWSAAEWDLQFT